MLTGLKQTRRYGWLAEVPATVYTQRLRDLDAAFAGFFAGRAKFPRFKKKGRGHEAVRFQLDQRQIAGTWQPGRLLKLPGLGPVKLKWSRLPAGMPKMATVRRDPAGRYGVTLAVEEAIEAPPVTDRAVGIDLGVKDLLVGSDGSRDPNPRHLGRRLRRAQRALSRKKKGSGRYRRQKAQVARLHARVADAREDTLHQATARLIRENQAICLEDLNVRGMMANRKLARTIGDAGFHELRRQLAYKAGWYGRELAVIDRWEPTSKTCSACGHVLAELPLSVREWTCPACGAHHDRDHNAAVNILRLGLEALGRTAPRSGVDARGGVQPPQAAAA